jgi:hypothetical protein
MGVGEGKRNAGKISWELVKRNEMLILSAFHFFLGACEGNRNAGKIRWELVKGKEKKCW